MSSDIATGSLLRTLFRQLFVQDGGANDMQDQSFWGQFMPICLELQAQMLRYLDVRLAMHNSMVALVELTDNCTLRHSAHALYHCRSPYVPMLTALTLYHVIRDGIAWTVGGLMLALIVGNVCINVFYKMVHQSFLQLGLPLPAPAIHCEILPEQQQVHQVPLTTSTISRPTPLLTLSSLGVSPLFGSETVEDTVRERHRRQHPLVQLFEQHSSYNALTGTSSSSSSSSSSGSLASSSSTHGRYEYRANASTTDADGYEYDDADDDNDENTASTISTAVDNVQNVFGRVLQELCEKVEVCHDQ